jgi:thiol-disulfide isomerase/thioredoxin
MRKALTFLVSLMWATLLLGGAFRPQASGTEGAPRPQVGHPAPAFEAFDLEGNAVALSDLRGRAVMLNFWASWCPPCRIEMPELDRLTANLPPGTAILAVNVTNQEASPQAVRSFLTARGHTFPVALDPRGTAADTYRVIALPTNLFISPEGAVTARINGPLSHGAMVDYLKAAGR